MSRMTNQTYPIGSSRGVCARTGRELAPGERIVAILLETDGDGFERIDIAEEAWDDAATPAGTFAYWRATVPEPRKKQGPVLEKGDLLELFESLEEADQPAQIALRFVISLLLMRKRALQYEGREERDGQTITRYRRARSEPDEPLVEVVDPGLDAATFETMAAELEALTAEAEGPDA
ncbi:MAG: hypothetical protein AAGD00_10680 [Planctomycetota bacterium]